MTTHPISTSGTLVGTCPSDVPFVARHSSRSSTPVFEFIFIVTRGGPAYGSEVLATFAYRHAFFEGDVGQAAAAACVMSLFGLCATAVYLWLQITDDAQST